MRSSAAYCYFSFRVGAAEKAAWMRCMRAALEETLPEAELRHELEAAFERAARGIVNRDTWTSD
jgi:hemoglobin